MPWLVTLLERIRTAQPSAPLFRITQAQFAVLFMEAFLRAGLPLYVPYQLRRGNLRTHGVGKDRSRRTSDTSLLRYEALAGAQLQEQLV